MANIQYFVRTIALFALAAALSLGQSAQKYEKTQGYVSDFAGVLNDARRSDIEQICRMVETGTGVQIAVVTVPSLDGEPIEDFTNSLARKWGVGQKGSNQGLMLLLAIKDRKTRTEVGYGLEAVMPDGYVGSVQRSMREELRAGKYGEAIIVALVQFQRRLEDEKSGIPAPQVKARRGFQQSSFPFWVMAALLLFFFLVVPWLSRRGRSRYACGRGGRYYGGDGGGFPIWTSGGFGGSSDSGGSGGSDSGFGGFGGGDFGGGGASSDW